MGSYENIVKIEEIRKRMDEGDYTSAQKILDTIDRKKVKNSVDMSLMAEVYTQNERYDDAMELLLKIYQKTKTRKLLFQLVEICIMKSNAIEAEKFLSEFEKMAPRDFYKYIFRYKIDKLKQEPYEKLIETLVTLKKTEYMEPWAYELAKLYYKAGMEEECIRECSDIVLWFGEGVYVEKAKMLRAYYSGEKDKDRVIEELKRRAQEDKTEKLSDTNQDRADTYIEDDKDYTETTETSDSKIEDTFKVNSDLYLTADLIREVEDILSNGQDETDNSEDYVEDCPASEDILDTASVAMDLAEIQKKEKSEEGKTEGNEIREKEASEASTFGMSEYEIAEREVEEALYQLLEQEDMDEEDKRLRELSNELGLNLEEIFENFLHVIVVKKQLIKSIELILNEPTKSIQMMITGTKNSGKSTLAKDLTIFFHQIGRLKSTRVAKIDAEKMNGIDVLSKKDTLRDSCLIVENASELNRATIDQLLELIKYFRGDIIVIFEENKKNINALFRECPKLMELFKNRIHLPETTKDL